MDGFLGFGWPPQPLLPGAVCCTLEGRENHIPKGRTTLHLNRWAREIAGALTAPVLYQYLLVWDLLRNVVLNPLQSDRFVRKWSPDGKYSASSAYRAFFHGSTNLPGAKEL